MSFDFNIGDFAECIDARPQDGDDLPTTGLALGDVYTVTGILNDEAGRLDRCKIGLALLEIAPFGGRVGFCADRFRKVQS